MFFISLEGKAFMHTKVSKFYYMNNLPEILFISEIQASANQSLKSKGHILRQDLWSSPFSLYPSSTSTGVTGKSQGLFPTTAADPTWILVLVQQALYHSLSRSPTHPPVFLFKRINPFSTKFFLYLASQEKTKGLIRSRTAI